MLRVSSGPVWLLVFTERTKELSTLLWLHGEDHDPKE